MVQPPPGTRTNFGINYLDKVKVDRTSCSAINVVFLNGKNSEPRAGSKPNLLVFLTASFSELQAIKEQWLSHSY